MGFYEQKQCDSVPFLLTTAAIQHQKKIRHIFPGIDSFFNGAQMAKMLCFGSTFERLNNDCGWAPELKLSNTCQINISCRWMQTSETKRWGNLAILQPNVALQLSQLKHIYKHSLVVLYENFSYYWLSLPVRWRFFSSSFVSKSIVLNFHQF